MEEEYTIYRRLDYARWLSEHQGMTEYRRGYIAALRFALGDDSRMDEEGA